MITVKVKCEKYFMYPSQVGALADHEEVQVPEELLHSSAGYRAHCGDLHLQSRGKRTSVQHTECPLYVMFKTREEITALLYAFLNHNGK